MDLTQEQLDLMWEHFRIDNPIDDEPVSDSKYRDDEYDKAEKSAQQYSEEVEEGEDGRLPIQDFESYSDPDFDAEWNATDEVSDSEVVSENEPESTPLNFEEPTDETPKGDTSLYKGEEWTEV